jgi:hypothetical protein
MKKYGIALAILPLLAACGGSPSDDDVRHAVMSQVEGVAGQQGADMLKQDIAKLRVIGCKKADPEGYQCDVTGLPIFGGNSASIRLVKDGSTWRIVQ